MKRMLDLFIALGLLILLGPLMVVVSLMIKTRMGSPVLFKQQRPGLNGHPFTLYKFRTMELAPDDDNQQITHLGNKLRKLSLDELPQLINVVKNDMSLVGPRPLLMEYLPFYTKHQAQRHDVKPGITGWAQVNGRNALSWEKKFELDRWYVHNHSMWIDCKILGLTLLKTVKQDGINQQTTVTMPKFNDTKEEV